MPSEKIRADLALVERGLADSRQKALRYILAAQVYAGEKKIEKAGQLLTQEEAQSLLIRESDPYVSRAAHKLLGAFEHFPLDVQGAACIDVGSSTGGFTQVLLEKGASAVYAVDVGYGQLHYSLREDPRVIVLERENMRHLGAEKIPQPIDFFTMDVSFISAKLLLRPLKNFLKPKAQGVLLIKPQFEAGKGSVQKGIVTKLSIHREVLEDMLDFFYEQGWTLLGLEISPIKGTKGNTEYIAHLQNAPDSGKAEPFITPELLEAVKNRLTSGSISQNK